MFHKGEVRSEDPALSHQWPDSPGDSSSPPPPPVVFEDAGTSDHNNLISLRLKKWTLPMDLTVLGGGEEGLYLFVILKKLYFI